MPRRLWIRSIQGHDLKSVKRVAILGAGAWGTALANVVARPGRDVLLWTRRPDLASALAAGRENKDYLPGVKLGDGVRPSADLTDVASADVVLAVVPAQKLRSVLAILPRLIDGVPIVVCAKGIEQETGMLMSDVVAQCRPGNPPVVLSGPSFAADVGRGRPTAVTLAAADEGLARRLAADLGKPAFRLYFTTDLKGVEIGGAAKNVLAIACGIAAGLDLGASASAALVARGFAELSRFGRAEGARAETLMGLSGLGDLVLTCSSAQSRNFAFGRALGLGRSSHDAAEGRVVEGAATASILVRRAQALGVEMPIAEAVTAILAGTLDPGMAIDHLLSRPIKAEADRSLSSTD